MGQKPAAHHAVGPACGGVLALRPRLRPPPSPTPLRALYDEAGLGASWLARSLAGRRITCSGLLGPVPSGAEDWLAIGEALVLPCPACGGDHHWPVGVLAVQAPQAPRRHAPFAPATVHGVLDTGPGASEPAGIRRLALRDACFLDP